MADPDLVGCIVASDPTPAGRTADVDPARWPPAPSGVTGTEVVVVDAPTVVDRSTRGRPGADSSNLPTPVDAVVGLTVGAAAAALQAATVVARTLRPVARPALAVLMRPPLVPQRFWPATRLGRIAQDGRVARERAERQVVGWVDAVVPAVLDAMLDRVNLTDLVLDRVALGRIVDSIDLDSIADRLDLDRIVDRLPVSRVIDLVDVDAVVEKVDLDAVVARIDIDDIASKLDLDAILQRVDVDAVVEKVDLDAVVARIDLQELANQVIDGIDLPQIIRESSGAMASETVIGVRMRSADADERLNRLADRVLLRRRRPQPGEVPRP